MNIEYQITFQRMEDMVQEQLALSPIHHDKPIELPEGKLSLEQLELGATRLRGHYGYPQRLIFQSNNGETQFVTRKLRFEQDVMAHITPKAKKGQNSKDGVALDTAVPLVLELEVFMEVKEMAQPEQGTQLRIAPSASIVIELVGIIGMPLKDSFVMPSYRTTIPLDVHTICTLLGSTKPVTGASIVASKEHDFIAIRIQLGQLAELEEAKWADFLEGFVAPRLRGRQWAMFVDRNLPQVKPAADNEQTPVAAPGNEAAFLAGAQTLWRNALQQASAAALMWLSGNERAAKLMDTPIGVSSDASHLEMQPNKLNGRTEIVVMRLS